MRYLFRIHIVDPQTGEIWLGLYIARSKELAQIKMFTGPKRRDDLTKDTDDYDIKIERIMKIRGGTNDNKAPGGVNEFR